MDDIAKSHEEVVRRRRRIGANVLVAGAVLVLVLAVVAGWVRVQLLDTDTWVETSRQSLAEPEVSSAVSRYAVDQLFAHAQPEELVREAAPARLDPLVGPATGALREGAYAAGERAMESEQLNQAWADANRAAHERLVTVVDGEGQIVRETPEGIRLDVRPLLVAIAQRIGLSGERVAQVPDSVALVEPPNSAAIERTLEALRQLDRAAPLLALLAFVLLVAAIAVAPTGSRRSLVIAWGISIAVGGVVLGILRASAAEPIAAALTDQPSWRDAILAVYGNITELLRLAANAMVLVGIVTISGAWYVGPSRAASAAREVTVPGWRRYPLVAWAALAIVAWLAFTRVPALESRQPLGTLLLLVLLAAGFEAIRRIAFQLEAERESSGIARAALTSLRGRFGESPTQAPPAAVDAQEPAPDVASRLERLADLHDRGVLHDDEFDAAKARLLAEPISAGRARDATSKAVDEETFDGTARP